MIARLMDFQTAIEFVVRCHTGQTRKGERNGIALPYVTHCFEVFKTLWRCGACDEVTGKAALGHDILEDCPNITESEIRTTLGDAATELIRELTFVVDPTSALSKAEQKAAYMAGFGKKSVEALAVKACDRYVNVCDWLHDDPLYAAPYLAKADGVYAAIDARRSEIDARFSTGTADRLLALKTELQSRIADVAFRRSTSAKYL